MGVLAFLVFLLICFCIYIFLDNRKLRKDTYSRNYIDNLEGDINFLKHKDQIEEIKELLKSHKYYHYNHGVEFYIKNEKDDTKCRFIKYEDLLQLLEDLELMCCNKKKSRSKKK